MVPLPAAAATEAVGATEVAAAAVLAGSVVGELREAPAPAALVVLGELVWLLEPLQPVTAAKASRPTAARGRGGDNIPPRLGNTWKVPRPGEQRTASRDGRPCKTTRS